MQRKQSPQSSRTVTPQDVGAHPRAKLTSAAAGQQLSPSALGAMTAGDVQAGAPTRTERLERWREQPASVRPSEPRPRPCGGYMLGSGN